MMKNFKTLAVILPAMSMCMPFSVMAANTQKEYVREASEFSKGILVSEDIVNYEDGTSSVERVYIQNVPSSRATFGTDTFTKTKDWHTGLSGNGALIISLSVTGTFDWDSTTKKVKVYDVSGEVVDVNGGDISDEKTSTSGNNTSKATGTFSCKRTIWSGSTTYKVSISCNYKGTNS